MTAKEPLNQILYGPPGTGKTYNTIYKALDILEPTNLSKEGSKDFYSWSELENLPEEKLSTWEKKENGKSIREIALGLFNKYKEEGRIVMTTFHQSMSYEDFIEGIKPKISQDTKNDNSNIAYNIRSGSFKQTIDGYILSKEKFDQFWRYVNENEQSCIEFNGKDKFKIIAKGNNSFQIPSLTNGKNHGGYINFSHLLNIKLGKDPGTGNNTRDKRAYAIYSKIAELYKDYPIHVFIIDEINRGNVANIFGELITLIEDDKRLGKPEAIKVKLPYSGEEFGVPGNLYIIGTMNTADRSVEALDSALRRRFSFTEIMPKPDLLKDVKISGVNISNGNDQASLADLLYTINKRIEILKDREHQIGHSYFMQFTNKEMYPEGVTPDGLKGVFYNKIIPLLQEYFYGDYEKIQKVIGNGFVEKEKEFIPFAANTNENETTTEDLYKITSEPDMNNAIVNLNIQPFQD